MTIGDSDGCMHFHCAAAACSARAGTGRKPGPLFCRLAIWLLRPRYENMLDFCSDGGLLPLMTLVCEMDLCYNIMTLILSRVIL